MLSVLWSDTLFWKQQNNYENKPCFVLCKYLLQQLIEKRKEKRAAELVKQDDEVIVKLEDSAIEHSKSVDSAVLGKYNIWRKENENENQQLNAQNQNIQNHQQQNTQNAQNAHNDQDAHYD